MKKHNIYSVLRVVYCAFPLLLFNMIISQRLVGAEGGAPLDYVVIRVNEQNQIVHAGETLSAIRGDILTIVGAVLQNTKQDPGIVNVVGYDNPQGTRDDRGFRIDSAQDLNLKWSTSTKSETYDIKVMTHSFLNGLVKLHIEVPKVKFVIARVNGRQIVVQDKESLKIKANDTLRIEKVVTNLPEVDRDVKFIMVNTGAESDGIHHEWEVHFFRHNRQFGSLAIQVEPENSVSEP